MTNLSRHPEYAAIETLKRQLLESQQENVSLLKLLAQIREIVEVWPGKLMQDELVEHIRKGWPTKKPTIPEVIDRFAAYYRTPGNGAWGSLHIVLDDGNVDDDNVKFCVKYAEDTGDVEGAELARILLKMSWTQRNKLGRVIR